MSEPIVLCYHALSDDWPAALAVRPDRFERQIELMLERGYTGATFSEAVLSRSAGRTLAVTFDDAFQSVIERAFPILERLGIPATVFAVTDFADSGGPLQWDGIDHWRGGPYASQLAGMTWDELRGLADAGWEIGSHTLTHPHLTQIPDADLSRELADSRERCSSRIDRECTAIAYPYGDVDARVVAAAKAAGYKSGAALPSQLYRGRKLDWPRVGVYWRDDLRRFKLKVSPVVRAARLLDRRRRSR